MLATQDSRRIILVHYHEIGLKGHNRSAFEKQLLDNLRALLKSFPISFIDRISGRVLVVLKDDVSAALAIECASFIKTIPGVARVSCGYRCEREMDLINACAISALGEALPFESFKVKARRAHTDFPIDSMELNKRIGSVLHDAYPDKLILMKNPDVVVGVEIVQGWAYVYAFSEPGIGGLPVGVSGKLACLLSTGIDSPVALWKMARRGAICLGVHFSGAPETTDASEYLVRDIAEVLMRTGCIKGLCTVKFGTYQRAISLEAPPKLRVILYRRLMMKFSERFAISQNAKALVTGESLGQVASQTLDNIRCTDAAVDMPIFRPLIGADKQEIIRMSEELGTFELSTTDSPDCCTLFMPRSPETHARLAEVEAAEGMFPIDDWVDEMMASSEYSKLS